jgi:uncharacterized protein YutE (UPF0331/DUF86 family)
VLDSGRILAKLDELDGYQGEFRQIMPSSFVQFKKVEKKRACERLLQVSIECVIDVCALIVSGLRLGLPSEQDDLFERLEEAGIISSDMKEALKKMKGFRNLLVHEYGRLDDEIVYDMVRNRLSDFTDFKKEIIKVLD